MNGEQTQKETPTTDPVSTNSDVPGLDYTIQISEPYLNGIVDVTSSVPGLFLAGSPEKILAEVPRAVAVLRKANGHERPRSLEERQPNSNWHDAGSNPAGGANSKLRLRLTARTRMDFELLRTFQRLLEHADVELVPPDKGSGLVIAEYPVNAPNEFRPKGAAAGATPSGGDGKEQAQPLEAARSGSAERGKEAQEQVCDSGFVESEEKAPGSVSGRDTSVLER